MSAGPASLIGIIQDSEEFRTNSHRLADFARAVDDTNPAHLTGQYAPPVFHHIPVMQSMMGVIGRLTQGFVMHGEHDFVFAHPMVPGMRLFTTSSLVGVRGIKAGLSFIIQSDIRTADGALVSSQFSTCLERGTASDIAVGTFPPARPKPERAGAAEVRYALTSDQTRRYADAARDYSPYTIDPAVAAQHGFPAPIVHGMCTLAFAARAIVDAHCGGLTPRLKRLGARFAHPLFLLPGQTLTVSHWAGPDGTVGFEAIDRDGNAVIRNGYAEVSA